MKQLSLLGEQIQAKEDITQVMTELSRTCMDCRLGTLHPSNRGIIWRGSPLASLAVIAEAPGDKETEMGQPLVGPSGQEWERWAKYMELDTKRDCFLTNVVQCQPPKMKSAEGRPAQRAPDKEEIAACFGPRCLRILKTMPNLDCILTLGWVAAKALLGGEPKSKTHEGQWFSSSLLPGVAIYCMVHPSYLLREPSAEKSGRVEDCLRFFRREYLESKKVVALAMHAKKALEEVEI